MDPLKDAFERIKFDISSLKLELQQFKLQISQLKHENNDLKEKISQYEQKIQQTNQQTDTQAIPTHIPTQVPTPTVIPTHIPTLPYAIRGLETPNIDISTGNRGVPTDKPTNRQSIQQTNQQMENKPKIHFLADPDSQNSFSKAQEILNSLDSIKKDIRLKFKRLTSQEMAVFTALYSLQNQNIEEITYKIIAQELSLSESSIRDYIHKIILKGIPIQKIRQNNKKITLSVSPELQKTANLSTIIKLREL